TARNPAWPSASTSSTGTGSTSTSGGRTRATPPRSSPRSDPGLGGGHNPLMRHPDSRLPEGVRRRVVAVAAGAILLAAPAIVVGAVYAAPLVSHHIAAPVGYDAPKYLWRTTLVQARGIDALPHSIPPPFQPNADRPGLPTVWTLLSAWLHVSIVRIALAFPVFTAVCIGLAAGALGHAGLRLPRWTAPLFVVATGASINVSRMAAPSYNDNLLVSVLVVGAG